MKIVIVGAGIVGLVTAYELLRAGHAVDVYEKEAAGSGSSGKSLGLLIPSTMERGIDAYQRDGIARWPQLAADLIADASLPGVGVDDILRVWPQLPDGRLARQLHLPLIFKVIKAAIEHRGGRVFEYTPPENDVEKLLASPEMQEADVLLLAAGWGNAGDFHQPGFTVMAGQAIRLGYADGDQSRLKDLQLVVGNDTYVCPDWDGTVLVGSRSWSQAAPGDPTPRPELATDLRESAVSLVGALADTDVLDAWVGFRPLSNPRLPLIRKVEGGSATCRVLSVAGLGKVGLGVAPMVAQETLKEVSASS